MIQDKGRADTTGTPATEEDGFLSRWSRRKREVARTESAQVLSESAPQPQPDPDESRSATSASRTAGAEPELPPIESLNEDSDYRPFLSSKVSEKVQRMALRKLFSSAGFNVRDGLDDYDDDFTVFEPLGNIITADMKHQAEVEEARERARRLAAGETDSDATVGDTAHAETASGEAEQDRPAQAASASQEASGPQAEAEPDNAAGRSAAGPETTEDTTGRVG